MSFGQTSTPVSLSPISHPAAAGACAGLRGAEDADALRSVWACENSSRKPKTPVHCKLSPPPINYAVRQCLLEPS